MSERNLNSYVNGTSALKIPRWVENSDEATIIMFPSSRLSAQNDQAQYPSTASKETAREAGRIKRFLESSEMYCSLRFESMWGVPYNLFSNRAVTVLSAGATVVGVVSLILGA